MGKWKRIHKNNFFLAIYPYHFLTVAICWNQPTNDQCRDANLRFVTSLTRSLSHSSLSSRQLGHITFLLHYFC